MAAHGGRRLLAMADNLGHVIGIELLAAAQGCDFHAPLTSSAALEAARALIRAEVPMMHDDHHFAPDLARATALVRGGSIAGRSEEHTSELQSLMRIPYAVYCVKTKTN